MCGCRDFVSGGAARDGTRAAPGAPEPFTCRWRAALGTPAIGQCGPARARPPPMGWAPVRVILLACPAEAGRQEQLGFLSG